MGKKRSRKYIIILCKSVDNHFCLRDGNGPLTAVLSINWTRTYEDIRCGKFRHRVYNVNSAVPGAGNF